MKARIIRIDNKASEYGITAFRVDFATSTLAQVAAYMREMAANDRTIDKYSLIINGRIVYTNA